MKLPNIPHNDDDGLKGIDQCNGCVKFELENISHFTIL